MAETAEAENREVGQSASRTAGEAGWHVSRYNLSAPIPGTKKIAIANIFKGNCAEYTPIEMYLLSVLDELDVAVVLDIVAALEELALDEAVSANAGDAANVANMSAHASANSRAIAFALPAAPRF